MLDAEASRDVPPVGGVNPQPDLVPAFIAAGRRRHCQALRHRGIMHRPIAWSGTAFQQPPEKGGVAGEPPQYRL
jgi:hypothetical protein